MAVRFAEENADIAVGTADAVRHRHIAAGFARLRRMGISGAQNIDDALLQRISALARSGTNQVAIELGGVLQSIDEFATEATVGQFGGRFDPLARGPVSTLQAIDFLGWRTTNLIPGESRYLFEFEAHNRAQSLALIFSYVSTLPWEEANVNDILDAALEWPTDADHGLSPREVQRHRYRLRATIDELHAVRPNDVRTRKERLVSEMEAPVFNGLMLVRSLEEAREEGNSLHVVDHNLLTTVRPTLRNRFGRTWPTAVLNGSVMQEINDTLAADRDDPSRFRSWRRAIEVAYIRDPRRVQAPWLTSLTPEPGPNPISVSGLISLLREQQHRGRIDAHYASQLIATVERVITHVRPDNPMNEIVTPELLTEAVNRWRLDDPDQVQTGTKQRLVYFRSAIRLVHAQRPWQVPDPFTPETHQPIRTLEELRRTPLISAGLIAVANYVEPRGLTTVKEKTAWRRQAQEAVMDCLNEIRSRNLRRTASINDQLLEEVDASAASPDAKALFHALYDASLEIGRIQSLASAERAEGNFRDNLPRVVFDVNDGVFTVNTVEERAIVAAVRRRGLVIELPTAESAERVSVDQDFAGGGVDPTRPDVVQFELG